MVLKECVQAPAAFNCCPNTYVQRDAIQSQGSIIITERELLYINPPLSGHDAGSSAAIPGWSSHEVVSTNDLTRAIAPSDVSRLVYDVVKYDNNWLNPRILFNATPRRLESVLLRSMTASVTTTVANVITTMSKIRFNHLCAQSNMQYNDGYPHPSSMNK